jgi:DNA topoisomerase-2
MTLQTYQPHEHVFHRPEMYIGSMSKDEYITFGCDKEGKMNKRKIFYVPGLYKIYDEILVNAIDHSRSSKSLLTKIAVNIDQDSGTIKVWNNGDAFPINKWENGKYSPEIAFGQLLTSTNYDDSIERSVGGQNGIGAKACNIFSTFFQIEIYSNGTHYVQSFTNNMNEKSVPEIKKTSVKQNSMCISFKPDFERFGMKNIDDDLLGLLKRRVYDAAACTPTYTKVYLDDRRIMIENFQDYVKMFVADSNVVYEKVDSDWDVAIACNQHGNGLDHISFVNGICTMHGGKHVDYFVNKICGKMKEMLESKTKKAILPGMIKNNMFIFINCTIPNPKFDGQNKNLLTTASTQFGGSVKKLKLEPSEKFYKQLYSSEIYTSIMDSYNNKLNNLTKKTDGKRAGHIKGVVKLDDANWAGGPKSSQCTLILTEGDSAKAMAMEGLSVLGRNAYGVFPLRGKLINVKDISAQKLADNKEVTDLKKILGLESNRKYDTESLKTSLRYGHIMLMTDSDHDGHHIRGLVINLFHTLWPSLLEQDFICSLLTPIVRVHKQKKDFYNLHEFKEWYKENPKADAKYYKGLGTWTAAEAKQIFKNMKKLDYEFEDDKDNNSINLAFNKKLTNERKAWIAEHTGKEDEATGGDVKKQSYTDFVNSELVQFSIHDVERSIPNLVDGFKPSQRKIIFGMFKRNSSKEARVAQIAGYISEHAAYHHGEASLHGTIIGMAQTFLGSGNNLPLLAENGMFGSRHKGGADSAAPRYIHTELNPVVSKLFCKDDFPLLSYLDDDGQKVEPEYYVPIIPLVLVNGTRGIGTGFSTQIPPFHPEKVLEATKEWASYYLRQSENVKEEPPICDIGMPYYKGFKGTIYSKKKNSYTTRGIYHMKSPNVVVVTELPIGRWTEDYKAYLEDLLDKGILKSYDSHTTDTIHFILTFNNLPEQVEQCDILRLLDLESSNISTNNMHLFDENMKIKKYEDVNQILQEFAETRMKYYVKRKAHKLKELDHLMKVASSKAAFIEANRNEVVIMSKRTEENIVEQLKLLPTLCHELGYDYLLKMPINSLSEQKFNELKKIEAKLLEEYKMLEIKQEAEIWLDDFEKLKLPK